MSFGNPFKNDDFEDLRRQEAYERQKDLETTKAVGNFFYLYIMYASIWLISSASTITILESFGVGTGTAFLIGLITGIIIFKIPYVKQSPFKSLIMICFIFGLFVVAGS